MTLHVSRCFMGSAEEIAAHQQLVADATIIGREEVLSFLRKAAGETLGDALGEAACWGEPGGLFDNSKVHTIRAVVANDLLRDFEAGRG